MKKTVLIAATLFSAILAHSQDTVKVIVAEDKVLRNKKR